ncbi:MAG: hypothetical protein ABSF89_06500 [Acidimicrobiales bacterium]
MTDWRRVHSWAAAAALTSPVSDRVTLSILGERFELLEVLTLRERAETGSENSAPRFDRAATLELALEAREVLARLGSVLEPPARTARVAGEWDWLGDISRTERARLRRHGWVSPHGLEPDRAAEILAPMLGEVLECTTDLERIMTRWLTLTRKASAYATLRRGWANLPRGYGRALTFEDLFPRAMTEAEEPAPDGWTPEPLEDLEPSDLEPLEDWTADRFERRYSRPA